VFTVSTSVDAVDAAPGDGVCEATPDEGDCTLRAAIGEANALAAEAIVPSPSITITLATDVELSIAGVGEDVGATGDLDLVLGAARATLVGDGHAVDAAGLDRAFDIRSGSVTFDLLVITGGRADGSGGGVRTAPGSTTSIVRSTFAANRSVTNGSCYLTRVTVRTCGGPPATVVAGGGAVANEGRLSVVASTFEQNAAETTGAPGCQVFSYLWAYCDATWGGGILSSGALYVGISTFDGNTSVPPASLPPVLDPFGAAIYATGESSVISSTATDNGPSPVASVVAGSIRSSIVASTSCGAPLVDADHNLRSPASCGVAVPGLFGPLTANGGPTRTRVPAVTSGAVDAIPWSECLGYTADQRGTPRVAGQPCDIGAVERQPADG